MTETSLNQNTNEEQKKVHFTIRLTKDEFSLKEYGPFSIVQIDKGFSYGIAGEPALPWRKYYVAIPLDAVPKDLQIYDITAALIASNIFVEPYQPNVPDTGKMNEWIWPDSKTYESDAAYPKCFAKIAGIKRIGSFAMAEIVVCPFRYYANSKNLELIERMDLGLTYTQTGIQSEKTHSLMTLRYEKRCEAKVKEFVLNPEHIPRFRSSRSAKLYDLGTSLPVVDYVIITSNLLAVEFNRLAKWRTMMGLNTRVVTIEDIQGNRVPDTENQKGEYPKFNFESGYNDGGTRDLQESIRNFIKWANVYWFSDHSPGYVLLGGNVEIIPSRKGLSVGEKTVHGINTMYHTTKYRLAISYGANSNISFYGDDLAFRIDATTTRIHMRVDKHWDFNKKGQFIVVKNGAVIKYDENASASTLGWYYVQDLVEGGFSDQMTDFIEIQGPDQYHGVCDNDNSFFLIQGDENYIETDLYYSDISVVQYPQTDKHDWDTNGNKVYGEFYYLFDKYTFSGWDGVNGFADIYIGRAPVKTSDEVKIFVDKIIRYETYKDDSDFGIDYPPDFAVSILLGSTNLNHFGEDPDSPLLDRSAIVNELVRSKLLDIDLSKWKFTRLYQGHENVRSEDQGPDLAEVTPKRMVDAIKKGKNAINIISHGDAKGFSGIITRQNIKGIENIPGIIFACACSTARFDFNDENGGSFGKCAILEPKGGAVAYIGATRMSCTGDGPMTVDFWAKWPKCERIAEMFDASVHTYSNIWKCGPNYIWNLLGDPAMRVWSDRPQKMNVSHPSEICTGYQTFQAIVTCNGHPVEGALVCLTMEGDPVTKLGALFATIKTDKSGNAYRTITPSAKGKMIISVSAKNMIPYISQVTIYKCEETCVSLIGTLPNDGCKPRIACLNELPACPPRVVSGCAPAVITCHGSLPPTDPTAHGCPAVDPMDFNWEDVYKNWIDPIMNPEYIYGVWGIRDIGEFIKRADTPEIQKILGEMPVGFRKPIAQMIRRIKDEKRL